MLAASIAFWGCESTQKTELDPTLIQPAVFTTYPTAAVVLDKDQPNASQMVFAWQPASYGYSAAVKYTLEAYTNEVGSKVVELGQTNKSSIALQNKAMSGALVTLGATPQSPITFNVRLLSTVGVAISDTISLPITITVTPFSLEPTPLWIIGDYCGWSHGNATLIYSENSNGIYKGWAYMNKEGLALNTPTPFAFTPAANWDKKWAGTMDALIKDGGENIEIPGGYCYLFDVNTKTLVATTPKKFARLGMVGEATPNGWDSPDTELKYDYTSRTFKATGVALKNGKEFKFRANDNWDGPDWGSTSKAGVLNLEGGGGNIVFDQPDGTYNVEVDLLKLVPTYTIKAQ